MGWLLEVSLVMAATFVGGMDVFWNVPTVKCPPNIRFNLSEFGIIQNSGDRFKGDRFNILYNPGLFPQVLQSGKEVNGGIPQRGSLEKHLFHLRRNIENNISEDYSGPAVIDFEEWQTTLRSSGVRKYKKISADYYRLQTKLGVLPTSSTNLTADDLFENASRPFLEKTLLVAREVRPKALWGYYHYPYCKNYKPHVQYCAPAISEDNDKSQWIYNASVALYPSLYLLKHNYTSWEKNVKTKVILDETDRLAARAGGRPIYAYTRFGYRREINEYLTPGDLMATLGQVATRQPAGLIIWGSSRNVNSSELCHQLHDYVTYRLGPFVRWLLSRTERQLRLLAGHLAAGRESFNSQVALLEERGVFGMWPVTDEAARGVGCGMRTRLLSNVRMCLAYRRRSQHVDETPSVYERKDHSLYSLP